jgi:membrane protein implicated in regulation of membrane protease activity
VASDDHPLLLPVVSLAYAGTVAALWLAIDQLAEYMPGPWFELLGAALLLLSLMTIALLLRTAWRRHRERLDRRGLVWAGGALAAALLAAVAVYGLVENFQISSVISGADVHLTRPLIESLPRPPGATLLDEQPGLADTETISQDFIAQDLNSIVPYYEAALVKDGWVEDEASATTSIVRFTKGEYVLAVAIDPPSSSYTLTIDRPNPSLLGSPSASANPSP